MEGIQGAPWNLNESVEQGEKVCVYRGEEEDQRA